MTTYEVEVHVTTREVYQIDADSAEEAKANWSEGELVVSEALWVEDVESVTEVDD